MKKVLLLLLFPVFVFAQKEQVIYEKLANQTCECINSKKNEKISQIELGLCVIGSLGKLSDKDKKIINYNSEANSIDKVSEQVGMQMVSICPDVFTDMLQNEETSEVASDAEVTDTSSTGIFQSMVSNQFNTIIIMDSENQKREFIWLFPFEGDALFIKNKIIKGDKIEILYREQNFFDPKINDYRIYNEILKVKLQ
jgi:hypothetical protein